MALHETVVVPWFSRQEWLEVYQATYSDDVDRWKEARDTMLVWQARVSKLPVGVDLTLPLLQAKIVNADPFVDEDVKSIMQATALQRFVSSVVKLPLTKYYTNQSMHKLAADIGLPGHLVDLRNEIIHGEKGWAGGCTISEALETAFKWINGYYWEQDCTQMKPKKVDAVKQNIELKSHHKILKKFASLAVAGSKRHEFNLSGSDDKLKYEVLQHLEKFYDDNSEDCIAAIIKQLFELQGVKSKKHIFGKNTNCRCSINTNYMAYVDRLLSSFLKAEGSAELLISSLINRMQDNEYILSKWVNLLIKSLLKAGAAKGRNVFCQNHFLHLKDAHPVNWKRIVSELLCLEKEWATEIALRIVKSSDAGFSKLQEKKVSDLVRLIECDEEKDDATKNSIEEFVNSDIFDIESVLEKAANDSSNALKDLSSNDLSLNGNGGRTLLGILSHQRDNDNLYKELLLHYPSEEDFEPALKRKKVECMGL